MPSMIAMSNPDGTYTGVYVHEPFAPQVLIGSYMQRGKARRMINLGDLITLTGDPATCVAYRRDHGQPLDQTAPRRGTIEALLGTAQTRGCGTLYAMRPDNYWYSQPVGAENRLVQIVLA